MSARPPDAAAAHKNAIEASTPEFDAFVNGKTIMWWQQEKFAIALAAFEAGVVCGRKTVANNKCTGGEE